MTVDKYPYPAPMARRGQFEAHFDGRWLFVSAEGPWGWADPQRQMSACLPMGLPAVRQLINTLEECVAAYGQEMSSCPSL